MCDELRHVITRWEKLSLLAAVGKRHMDAKCTLVTALFYRLFRVASTRAQWLRDCARLREVLRLTEELSRLQYANDREALSAIEALKRVPSLSGVGDACAICLSSFHHDSDNDGVELECGHRFHDTCICRWFHSQLNCPVCRARAVTDAA